MTKLLTFLIFLISISVHAFSQSQATEEEHRQVSQEQLDHYTSYVNEIRYLTKLNSCVIEIEISARIFQSFVPDLEMFIYSPELDIAVYPFQILLNLVAKEINQFDVSGPLQETNKWSDIMLAYTGSVSRHVIGELETYEQKMTRLTIAKERARKCVESAQLEDLGLRNNEQEIQT